MDHSVKLIGDDGSFVIYWKKLFRILCLWLCLYPVVIIAAYEAYYWLRFAEFLDLDTYKTVPPRLLVFFYNLTNWEGINLIIYKFLQLPIFVTMPLVSFFMIFIVYQSVLAIYYFVFDSRTLIKKLARRFSK
ncbi:MAG: hypothetical protein WAN11_05625 [Syntrophobacteraceae bacterium]